MKKYSCVNKKQCHDVMEALINNQNIRVSEIAQSLDITEQQVNEALIYLDQKKYFSNMRLVRENDGNMAFVPVSEGMIISLEGMMFLSSSPKDDFITVDDLEIHARFTSPASSKMVPTIFISYNWGNKEYVDQLEIALKGKANIHRDTHKIGPWKSIGQFMETIRDQDFAVLIISDAYLKSVACMYEVMQLMKEKNWQQRIMPVVHKDAAVYDPLDRVSYIKYWSKYCEKLDSAIKELPSAATVETSADLRKAQQIRDNISTFMNYVSDSNNPKAEEAIDKILSRIGEVNISECGDTTANTFKNSGLSAQAEILLRMAAEEDGTIGTTETMDGVHIRISHKDITQSRNPRDMALWKSALTELQERGLIDERKNKGGYSSLYTITYGGYQVYDQLKNKILGS